MASPHLCQAEYCHIAKLHAQGIKACTIALRLARQPSTISRALAHLAACAFDPALTWQGVLARRAISAANHPTKPTRTWQSVHKALRKHHSPEQIMLRRRYLGLLPISTQAIYNHIARDKDVGGDLYKLLRRQPRVHCRADGRARSWAHEALPIAQRPQAAKTRARIGHLEGDTLAGRKKEPTRILQIIDRASSHVRLALLQDGTADSAQRAAMKMVLASPHIPVKTITTDRGGEFARFPELFKGKHHVCDAYRPDQKGLCENAIGLLRQYWPKHKRLKGVTDKEVQAVQDALNNRPRKRLNGRTPHEVISARLRRVAVRG